MSPIHYTDIFIGTKDVVGFFVGRFYDFGYAQETMRKLEEEGKPFVAWLFGDVEDPECYHTSIGIIGTLTRFRIPR